MGSSWGRSPWAARLGVGCIAALGLAVAAPSATADEVVCAAGSGAGQCSAPGGVAVDRTAERLYVADSGNEEVDVYDAVTGAFVGDFPVGSSLGAIAVDNNDALSSPGSGDVYVFDASNNRVLKLRPTGASPPLELVKAFGEGGFATQPKLAVGPSGVVYVADNIGGGDRRVQKFDHEGNPIETCSPLAPGGFGGNLMGFAVESSGGFYLANAGGRPIERYGAGCNWLEAGFHTSHNIQALAVDGEDNLFVSDVTPPELGGETAIYAYDPTATLFRVIYGEEPDRLERRPSSLAPLSAAGDDLFAAEGQGKQRVVRVGYPPPGPVVHPDPSFTEAVPPIGNTKATLATRINPEGKATSFRFQYVDEAAYQQDLEEGGDGFASAQVSVESAVVPPADGPNVLPIDPLFRLSSASMEVGCSDPESEFGEGKCLASRTKYRFRAIATNADSEPEERTGPVGSFETAEPFQLLDTWATRVGARAARVHAEANPFNIPLSAHFQYISEADYQQNLDEEQPAFSGAEQSGKVNFGSGEAPVGRGAQLHDLQPDTAYRYRVVLENFFESEAGPAHSFKTFALPAAPPPCPGNEALRAGPAAALPDCRAYEMVSPPDKGGGEVEVMASPIFLLPAELNKSAAAVPAQGRGFTYSTHRPFGDAISSPFTSQYLASRVPDSDGEWDAGEGWRSHGISPPREGAAFSGLWRDTQYKAFSEDLRWGWLRSDTEPRLDEGAIAGYPNLYRRDNANERYRSLCSVVPAGTTATNYVPAPQGASADAQIAVFRANGKLTANASSKAGVHQLYACHGGEELALASVLPPALGGKASEGNSAAGTALGQPGEHREISLHNAVSADGQRIYWSDSGAAASGRGKIYLRERPFAAGGECAGEAAPCTSAVSEAVGLAGSDRPAHFWTASADGSRAIFSFTEGPLAGNLYRFDAEAEAEPTSLIAEAVSGVAGFSEDASRIYLVSTQALAPGAQAGKANLYLFDAGEENPELVAVLASGRGPHSFCLVDQANPIRRCTRATPDGEHLLFMSQDPLTGYDNKAAGSGEAAAEVYRYDAGEKQLACLSCNPSGGRPVVGEGLTSAIAAQIPSWESGFQASRAISADGRRVFFESYDPLVLADTNGALDVYQWEEAGKGNCETAAHNHFPQNGGCLALISSGQSQRDSEFMDASADGRDVFFKTQSSLVAQDPGLVDVYDARVDGGFPPPPAPDPPCEGEACQSPPAPPAQQTPSSSVFAGPGNAAAPSSRRCRRPAGKAKRLAKRARGLRRAARRAGAPRRAKRLRRRAAGSAKRARRLSAKAKRCRARAEGARR